MVVTSHQAHFPRPPAGPQHGPCQACSAAWVGDCSGLIATSTTWNGLLQSEGGPEVTWAGSLPPIIRLQPHPAAFSLASPLPCRPAIIWLDRAVKAVCYYNTFAIFQLSSAPPCLLASQPSPPLLQSFVVDLIKFRSLPFVPSLSPACFVSVLACAGLPRWFRDPSACFNRAYPRQLVRQVLSSLISSLYIPVLHCHIPPLLYRVPLSTVATVRFHPAPLRSLEPKVIIHGQPSSVESNCPICHNQPSDRHRPARSLEATARRSIPSVPEPALNWQTSPLVDRHRWKAVGGSGATTAGLASR
ncbi:hypothetical protein F4780DRAFT_686615 [Xylariomycetidae sp. FL0641]|nr:hypothetical protein F4780DRAFT_686615 [Xylariomycetidae sp. FL0641]